MAPITRGMLNGDKILIRRPETRSIALNVGNVLETYENHDEVNIMGYGHDAGR